VTLADFETAVNRCYVGETAANDNLRFTLIADVNPVLAVLLKEQRSGRRVDLEAVECRGQVVDTDVRGPFDYLELGYALRQLGNRQLGLLGEPHVRPAAELNLRPRPGGAVNVVSR
jgi:hypothetical protein